MSSQATESVHPSIESDTADHKGKEKEAAADQKPAIGMPKELHRRLTTDRATTALTIGTQQIDMTGAESSAPIPVAESSKASADHVRQENSPTPSPSKTMMPWRKWDYFPTPPIDIPQYKRWICHECHVGIYFPTAGCPTCGHGFCRMCHAYETFDFKSPKGEGVGWEHLWTEEDGFDMAKGPAEPIRYRT